jgi:3'(2'), 5'-bisphosphate nucleotidase
MDTLDRLEALVGIARQAGRAILDIYAREFDVTVKADKSPLTQADLASHRVICDALAELDPETPVMSEESADIPFRVRRTWTRYWLVDPLDGTREFVKRNGEFTVNIALISDHYPVLGVVHVPVSGVTYFGSEQTECFRQAGDEPPQPVKVRIPTAEPPVVVGSRSHANPQMAHRLEPVGEHRMVSMGSSLKFCLVAEGKADFYPRLGPTSEWDTAAAQAVVEAAGGQVVTLDGKRLKYNAKAEILNPEFLVFGDSSTNWPDRIAAPLT